MGARGTHPLALFCFANQVSCALIGETRPVDRDDALVLERATRIELACSAWEASLLTRDVFMRTAWE